MGFQMNPMQLIGMLKNSRNPQQMIIQMLEQQSQGSPIMENLIKLAKNNDTKSIENFARNCAKERGIDYDKEFNSFKRTLGL